MSRRLTAVFSLLWLAAPTAVAASHDTQIIENCARDVDEDIVGLVELDAECPGLEPALVDAGLAPFISETQMEELTSAALSDLTQLRNHFALPPMTSLQVDGVAELAREIQQVKAERPLSWRDRLSQWLRQFFDRREQPGSSWLADWLRDKSVPQQVRDIIVVGLMLLVIVLALIVLINELRAAGVLRRRSSRKSASVSNAGIPGLATSLSIADVSAAPLRDQPSLLLSLVINALVDADQLTSARSLTHRELAARAHFDSESQREKFGLLAAGAEHARYGRELLPTSQIEALLAEGRALHAQLAGAASMQSARSS